MEVAREVHAHQPRAIAQTERRVAMRGNEGIREVHLGVGQAREGSVGIGRMEMRYEDDRQMVTE